MLDDGVSLKQAGWDPPRDKPVLHPSMSSTTALGSTMRSSPATGAAGMQGTFDMPSALGATSIPVNPMELSFGWGSSTPGAPIELLGVTARNATFSSTVMGAHKHALFPINTGASCRREFEPLDGLLLCLDPSPRVFVCGAELETKTEAAVMSVTAKHAASKSASTPNLFETHAFESLKHQRSLTAFTPASTHAKNRLRKSTARQYQSHRSVAKIRQQLAPLKRSPRGFTKPSASSGSGRGDGGGVGLHPPVGGHSASTFDAARARLPPAPIRLSVAASNKRRQRLEAAAHNSTAAGSAGPASGSPPASPGTGADADPNSTPSATPAAPRRLIASAGSNTLCVWSLCPGVGAPEQLGRAPGSVLCMHVVPDGLQALVRRSNGRVQLVSTNGDHRVLQEAHGPDIVASSFASNGRLAAAFGNNTVRVYRADEGARVGELKGHTASVSDVTYSPNCNTVASASQDGTIRLWTPALLAPGVLDSAHQCVGACQGAMQRGYDMMSTFV